MDTELKLSVVLATYNRAETLRRTLQYLAEQDLDPASFEVIVIDDGSPDHTRDVVEKDWMPRAPFKMTYLRNNNMGPGYAQNRGLEVAAAPLVLFMADDIWMTPGTLRAHLEMHAAHPEPEVAALGRVEQSPELRQISVFLAKWDSFRFKAFAGKAELPYYRFWACNISAKRDFVRRYGPYREHLAEAAHEDPELGYQLSHGGLRVLFCPQALGYHYHVVSYEQACQRRFVQGLKFTPFHELVPEPEIPVVYHVLHWTTLLDHVRALSGPRRRFLTGKDRNPLALLASHAARGILFNGVTVPMIWEPLFRRAETNAQLARWLSPDFYRGALFHHFLRGYREGLRRRRSSGQTIGQAGALSR